ncbi:serine hydrolase domain-containing protein [Actinoallomurus rhizosphaericola]|uniref:serine hydrolase domain-containing protein n=1 Tax=Actinoallomurus rhizosphaericola TaxID=2952536 RepID=UPI00209095DF|nr:serine hydrolase domain-containing protein [Actinoallomurus rhizosphaericola]MCO5993191.1 beta-lactamase family protein [Actinoallomurus rhizosphaericola]
MDARAKARWRTVTVWAACLAALAAPITSAGAAGGRAPVSPARGERLQRSLDAVTAAGAVGVQAEVVGTDGRWRGVSGHARLGGAQPVPRRGRFRIGSITKSFTATVLLQLAAQGRVGLDDPVERYLPGLVPGGRHITLRRLLNHTSGIADYLDDTTTYPISGREFLEKVRFHTFPAERLARSGVALPRYFPPGEGWHYSNTNYVLAGLIIEKVTGRSWHDEVTRRIVRPLGLHETTVPDHDPGIPGPHAHGYMEIDGRAVDITRMNPSIAGSAGAMISTTGDLDRFYAALLGGRLLPARWLAEMEKTVPIPGSGPAGEADGLGIDSSRLPCGVTVWGYDGGIVGYGSQSLHTADGRRGITLSVTLRDLSDPHTPQILDAIQSTVDTAFCGTR